jgi:DNA-binding NtrC family response regulator
MTEAPKSCVLIVDDEMFIRALISRRLDLKGYRVLQSSNTEEAYRVIQADKPDVVVCDVLMPGGDGVSFLPRVAYGGNKPPSYL